MQPLGQPSTGSALPQSRSEPVDESVAVLAGLLELAGSDPVPVVEPPVASVADVVDVDASSPDDSDGPQDAEPRIASARIHRDVMLILLSRPTSRAFDCPQQPAHATVASKTSS